MNYTYKYIYIIAYVAQLAKASDTQAVGHRTCVAGTSPVRTIKIGLKIIFRSDLI